jgi:hypothetical protein
LDIVSSDRNLRYLLSWAGIYHSEFMRYSDEI